MTVVYGTIAVLTALLVITEKNTMHSVFYLVLTFTNASIILIIKGVDYLGLLLIIVYVGAIAILFLFVVMMINLKEEETNRTRYIPIGMIVVTALMLEVYEEYPKLLETTKGRSLIDVLPSIKDEQYELSGETNVEKLGEVMYTWEQIMYGGLVLLVALIGAIVLTNSHTEGVKRQDVYRKWD